MKGAYFAALLLVTALYYINCSTLTTTKCNKKTTVDQTNDNGGELEDVLKNCTISVTNITSQFDKCFKDFGGCLKNLECLQNRTCLQSKNCRLPKEKSQTTITTQEIWDRIDILLDLCGLNVTELFLQMQSCIDSKICLTEETNRMVYQNLSYFLCNISSGFYNVSTEILRMTFPMENMDQYNKRSKHRDNNCKKEEEKKQNEATSEEKPFIKDCRVNAISLCESLEKCIEINHGSLPPVDVCGINATVLALQSVACMEQKRCLTEDLYEQWLLNNSMHLIRISEGFNHLSNSFWNISERFESVKYNEASSKEWTCKMKQIPIKPAKPTTPAFDKERYYANDEQKPVQEQILIYR